jgi:hypothetical protein
LTSVSRNQARYGNAEPLYSLQPRRLVPRGGQYALAVRREYGAQDQFLVSRLQPERERLRQILRKAEDRTPDELWDAISDALTRFSAKECTNYFAAAGYGPT